VACYRVTLLLPFVCLWGLGTPRRGLECSQQVAGRQEDSQAETRGAHTNVCFRRYHTSYFCDSWAWLRKLCSSSGDELMDTGDSGCLLPRELPQRQYEVHPVVVDRKVKDIIQDDFSNI